MEALSQGVRPRVDVIASLALALLGVAAGCMDGVAPDKAEAPDTGSGDSGSAGDSDSGGSYEPLGIPAGALILSNARIVDASGVREGHAIVIVGEEIHSVFSTERAWPADATVVDVGGASVVPGLIDAHVHLFHSGSTSWVGDTLAANLAAQLAWGVVGVADLGSPVEAFALRDRIADGEIVGPRVYATGPFLTAELSHPCETVHDEALCRFVDGDGGSQVSALGEADAIKVALADADFTDWPTPRLDLGDLADIVDAAEGAGQPVFAHIDEPEDALDALAAGVSVLAHPVFSEALDEPIDAPSLSTVSAFAGTGDLLDGSLLAEDLSHTPDAVRAAWTWLGAHEDAFAEGWVEGSAAWEEAARANLAQAIASGGLVIAGSDAGYWFVPHGLGLHRELDALVALGMSPLDALTAATAAPADLLGWEDMGFVDAGYRADLLVLAGRPDEDIRALREITTIYLGGQPWEGGDLRVAGTAADGAFCLEDADCASRCDLVDHVCRDACDRPYDRVGSCDEESWCSPTDALETTPDGVCRPGDACDLYNQDCEPASYAEGCVPLDLDTNLCLPSGPRTEGQSCSWTDPDYLCEQGAFCSWVTYTCYRLCDPDDPSACPGCTRQYVEGEPWFGVCL